MYIETILPTSTPTFMFCTTDFFIIGHLWFAKCELGAQSTIRVCCLEHCVVFMFVIGLSIEEPSLNRTATQPTLVAAKVWASRYPSLERKCGVFREKLSIETNYGTRCRSLGQLIVGLALRANLVNGQLLLGKALMFALE